MSKIVSLLQPFSMTQELIVYENGNKLDIVHSKIDDLSKDLLMLVDKYKCEEIQFAGNEKFAKGIGNKFQQEEMNKYNANLIKITYM